MTKESLVIGELTAEEKAQLEKWMNEPGSIIEVPDVSEKIKGYSWQTYVDAVKGMPQQQRVPAEMRKKAEEAERKWFGMLRELAPLQVQINDDCHQKLSEIVGKMQQQQVYGRLAEMADELSKHHRSCALRNGGRECSC